MTVQELLDTQPEKALRFGYGFRIRKQTEHIILIERLDFLSDKWVWSDYANEDLFNAILAAHAAALGVTSPDNKENETE